MGRFQNHVTTRILFGFKVLLCCAVAIYMSAQLRNVETLGKTHKAKWLEMLLRPVQLYTYQLTSCPQYHLRTSFLALPGQRGIGSPIFTYPVDYRLQSYGLRLAPEGVTASMFTLRYKYQIGPLQYLANSTTSKNVHDQCNDDHWSDETGLFRVLLSTANIHRDTRQTHRANL